jgi:class 3 adenylate cyclase/tetratricopeptide (TPR) repeat protein
MRCSKCGSENREGRKFCTNCGAPVLAVCPKCGAAVEPDEKFCGECGTALSDAALAAADDTQSVTASVSGERRHLTILFCDLVGSVTLSSQLDPEEWRATVAGYQRAASEAVTRFGGEVVRYVGDGIMAFFGYPVAHDNDAERAARAGLAILGAIATLNQQELGRPNLSLRIGIDSGPVVVGTGAGEAVDAFGDAANIAARVQATAEPDSVVVTSATHRLISGLFVVDDRGTHALKGIERPVQLYRVVRPSGMRSRFEAAVATRALTPFVGREDEMHLLLSRWARAREGEGQVFTIMGEPGIGKSRLLQEFRNRIAGDRHTWLEGTTATFFQNTPFYAVVEMLRQSFHWHSDQNNERRLVALEASLAGTGLALDEAVPLIAGLIELPVGDRYKPLRMTPEQKRKRLLAALVTWTIGAAKAQPMVLATEDLHWADPSTLEVTQLLVEQAATAPLLLLYTARPEFRAPWPMRAHHTQIALNRLSAPNVRLIVQDLLARAALSEETITTVIERTGGVPLFVEELTRSVLESGEAKISVRDIPRTLHDSLAARLDRLGAAAKKVAQVGAVIGREFSYELLRAVHPTVEADLQSALGELADAELLYVRGVAPDASYQFKHALIRDAAYEALLKSRRRELHLTVARIVNENFSVIKETHPEVLAHHWTEAGEAEPAVAEWQRAGERALERRAYREAEQHYRNAIGILGTLRESSERDAHELKLQVALGVIFTATQGYSSSQTKEAYARARVLIERTGGPASLEILNGLRGAAVTRGELRASLGIADEILQIAHAIGSPQALAAAHTEQGNARYYLGDFVGAREHFRLSLENYRPEDFRNAGNVVDRVMGSYMWAGATEWFLGFPDRAVRYTEDGLALARRLNNPFNIATAFGFATHVFSFRGNFTRVVETADQAIKVSSEFGFPIWNIIARIRRAWALAKNGEVSGATTSIREALAELDSMEFYLARALYLCLLGETQAAAGEIGEAIISVEQALQANSEEVIYHPLALTLRGELRLDSNQVGRAGFETSEQDFRDAVRIAQSISAKSLEVRATTSLARLLVQQGHRDEARSMLAEIYNWFTEGFDTADLKDAKTLLDELQS